MNLQIGYEAIYKEAAAAVKAGQYKFIYEKAGQVYGSKLNVPTENDHCFTNIVADELVTEESIVEKHITVEPAEIPVVEMPIVSTGNKRKARKVTTEDSAEVTAASEVESEQKEVTV